MEEKKMDVVKQPADTQQQQPGMQPVSDDVEEFMSAVRTYGKPVAIAIIVAAVAFFAVQMVQTRRTRQAEADSTALFQAQAPEELQQLSQSMKGPTAALALSMAASQYMAQDRYDEAQAAYNDFLARFPHHEFASDAAFGAAVCLEGMGEYESAANAFDEWLTANPGSGKAAQAVIERVRCLSEIGAFEEARIALEDFEAGNDDPETAARMEQAQTFLDRARRAAETAAAAPSAEPAPATEAASAEEPAAEPEVAAPAEEAAPAEPEAVVEAPEDEQPAAADKPAKKGKTSKKDKKAAEATEPVVTAVEEVAAEAPAEAPAAPAE